MRTRGLENIEIIKKDFFESSDEISFSAEDTVGVIIDITQETSVKTIVERVFSAVHRMYGVALLVIATRSPYHKNC